MNRLCERPGCSAPADVAYGFDADRLIVWLDTLVAVQGMRHGVLCRRHADAMIVPLGWMLDDRREPTPRLFTSPPASQPPSPPRRERRIRDDTGEQLRLDAHLASDDEIAAVDVRDGAPAVETGTQPDRPAAAAERAPRAAGEGEARADDVAWVPVFDPDDDLHGLLKARGRLLSRAFNGAPTDRR